MHSDLPPTPLRGYVQLSTSVVPGAQVPLVEHRRQRRSSCRTGRQALAVDKPHYLGPAIVATKDRPVRILFRNLLPTGAGGNLFLPVDTTVMGSGMGPNMARDGGARSAEPDVRDGRPKPAGCFTENRATLHLHGGISPWISDGTPHQWITPAEREHAVPEGRQRAERPGHAATRARGAMTFFYTNQQSARLMFYHDHAWGITRLNVYAGEAAPYLITDPTEQALVTQGVLPGRSASRSSSRTRPSCRATAQLAVSGPDSGTSPAGAASGSLWVPHVYSPAQNPGDSSGVNQFGRWAYGPWFWPPTSNIDYPPIANPYYRPELQPRRSAGASRR